MVKNDVSVAYDILVKVYRDGTYLNLIMKEIANKRVTKIVYGVLDHHYELNYIVNYLAPKGIKNNVKPIALIGAYMVSYMNVPINVVLNECKQALSSMGKEAVSGFIIALIKKVANKEYKLPAKSDKNYVEVKYNLPSFLVGMLRKDYPDEYENIIFAKENSNVHIRLNKNTTEKEILDADPTAEKTLTGYFVRNNKQISLLNFLGKTTYMSYCSTLIPESIKEGKTVLDACSAPGGKAVMLAQKGYEVTACDIHQHRVDLIRSYAERMNAKLTVYKQDARVFLKKWEQKFDVVLVDAPCSGMGVIGKKKDVVFNKTYDDILELKNLQQEILSNCAKYVKKGGLLVYSTCTVFKKENHDNVVEFLEKNQEFSKEVIDLPFDNDGEIQFLPDGKGMEGFYLCHLRKN